MRRLSAALAAAMVLGLPGPALACGMMVDATGEAELGGLETMLRWDAGTEDLVTVVGYRGGGEDFAWLLPLPEVPEVSQDVRTAIDAALDITEPPDREDHVPELIPGGDEDDTAVGGGAPGVSVLDRTTVENLRFVTLGATSAGELTAWMTDNGFAFHDRQEPVLQGYLDRGWVVVAARILPGAETDGSLVPVRFRFETEDPVYPLAVAGAGHPGLTVPMTLFTVTPFRPTPTTFDERVIRPDDDGDFPSPGSSLELRYAAPLSPTQAARVDAQPGRWLARYEAIWDAETLTDDLVLRRAADQSAVDFQPLLAEYAAARRMVYLGRAALIAVPAALVSLGVLLLVRRWRRRRAA